MSEYDVLLPEYDVLHKFPNSVKPILTDFDAFAEPFFQPQGTPYNNVIFCLTYMKKTKTKKTNTFFTFANMLMSHLLQYLRPIVTRLKQNQWGTTDPRFYPMYFTFKTYDSIFSHILPELKSEREMFIMTNQQKLWYNLLFELYLFKRSYTHYTQFQKFKLAAAQKVFPDSFKQVIDNVGVKVSSNPNKFISNAVLVGHENRLLQLLNELVVDSHFVFLPKLIQERIAQQLQGDFNVESVASELQHVINYYYKYPNIRVVQDSTQIVLHERACTPAAVKNNSPLLPSMFQDNDKCQEVLSQVVPATDLSAQDITLLGTLLNHFVVLQPLHVASLHEHITVLMRLLYGESVSAKVPPLEPNDKTATYLQKVSTATEQVLCVFSIAKTKSKATRSFTSYEPARNVKYSQAPCFLAIVHSKKKFLSMYKLFPNVVEFTNEILDDIVQYTEYSVKEKTLEPTEDLEKGTTSHWIQHIKNIPKDNKLFNKIRKSATKLQAFSFKKTNLDDTQKEQVQQLYKNVFDGFTLVKVFCDKHSNDINTNENKIKLIKEIVESINKLVIATQGITTLALGDALIRSNKNVQNFSNRLKKYEFELKVNQLLKTISQLQVGNNARRLKFNFNNFNIRPSDVEKFKSFEDSIPFIIDIYQSIKSAHENKRIQEEEVITNLMEDIVQRFNVIKTKEDITKEEVNQLAKVIKTNRNRAVAYVNMFLSQPQWKQLTEAAVATVQEEANRLVEELKLNNFIVQSSDDIYSKFRVSLPFVIEEYNTLAGLAKEDPQYQVQFNKVKQIADKYNALSQEQDTLDAFADFVLTFFDLELPLPAQQGEAGDPVEMKKCAKDDCHIRFAGPGKYCPLHKFLENPI